MNTFPLPSPIASTTLLGSAGEVGNGRLWSVHTATPSSLLPFTHTGPLQMLQSFRISLLQHGLPTFHSSFRQYPTALAWELLCDCREIFTPPCFLPWTALVPGEPPPLPPLTMGFTGLFITFYLFPSFFTSVVFCPFSNTFPRGTTILAAGPRHALWWGRWSQLEPAVFHFSLCLLTEEICSPCWQHLSTCMKYLYTLNKLTATFPPPNKQTTPTTKTL